jgi:hypothetical protein
VFARIIRERQSFVDLLQRAVRVIPFGFDLREPSLKEWRTELVSLADIFR